MFVELHPLDTLFVRDSRAFGVNEAHAVDSLFPPPPSVIFGAFRGGILNFGGYKTCKWGGAFTEGESWPSWFGDADNAGQLRQRGPVPAKDGTLFFPMPLDISGPERGKLVRAMLQITPPECSSLPTPYCLMEATGRSKPVHDDPIWLSADTLGRYLESNDADEEFEVSDTGNDPDFMMQKNLWNTERRVNVGIDPATYAGVKGRLFSLTHVRLLTGVCLTCEWLGPEAALQPFAAHPAENRLLGIGGERRAAMIRRVSGHAWPRIQLCETDRSPGTRFRLYLVTPGFFAGGWAPDLDPFGAVYLTADNGKRISVKLLAAAVAKPFCLGGYDIHAQQERPIRRMVPPGSVYYFETDQSLKEAVDTLNGRCVGDDPFLRAQGFGLSLVGRG